MTAIQFINGMTDTASNTNTQPADPIKCCPKCVSMHVPPWPIRLLLDAACTSGMCSATPYKTKEQKNTRGAFNGRMVCENIT